LRLKKEETREWWRLLRKKWRGVRGVRVFKGN
jgi:hypothetical protein